MAEPFDVPLPTTGQKPWSLNPAIEEVRTRVGDVEDYVSGPGIQDAIAEAAASVEVNDETVANLVAEPTSETALAVDAKIQPLTSDVGSLTTLTSTGRLSEAGLSATIGDATRASRPALPLARNAEWGPDFEKTGADLMTQAGFGLESIYIPCVIDVRHIPGALGNFYMYATTDHSVTTGGIAMAYADKLTGPWTTFSPGGSPYIYTVSGALQVEWCQVIWNPDTSLFHIFFHMGQGGELTRVVTSPSGLLNDPANSAPQQALTAPNGIAGDGITAYLNPFRIDHTWMGYILDGGKNHAGLSMAYSNDGITWQRDPNRLGYYSDLSESNGQRLTMHTAYPFFWRGQVWSFMRHAPHDSGLITTGEDWALARLTPDFRGPAGRPRIPAVDRLPDETSHIVPGCVIEDDGYLYAFYRANGPQGSFRVAIAEA